MRSRLPAADSNGPVISLYTFTLGRSFYLERSLRAVIDACASYPGEVEHHLCCQGVDLGPSTEALLHDCDLANLRFEVHRWPENIGLQVGMNRIVPRLRGDLVVKLDDDCRILSPDFFEHVAAVARLKPRAMFSPYPVGLIGTPGGPASTDRHVEYAEETNTFYTFRRVDHLGGLCRVSPGPLVCEWLLDPGAGPETRNEDTQYSRKCRKLGIEMFYLENALVVEHQESTLGQEARYREYFADRVEPPAGRLQRLSARLLAAGRSRLRVALGRR